ncbi:PREDICTED: myeloid differentiation primary response protein MyD88-B [Nicrophorus vespilloides]|uniref:Myeloid differentiation primary response protein MyD88-B n=1 Tax=Nicrophorus vespilloides TaxID=110193 RepID=A0ABM1MZP9_NICVS|nr:PREDICTED: myeloid differentiation primary response protein MyD88-B [Nicrophorus vespilloides]
MADSNNGQADEEDLYNVTIWAMKSSTKSLLSSLLNPIKVIPTEKGLPRYWLGLAELIGIGGEKIPNLKTELDPTLKLLNLWAEKDKTQSTIRNFLKYLEELNRFDVIYDIKDYLEEDIKQHKEQANGQCSSTSLNTDRKILTVDDVSRISQGLEPQNYDAFVLFADEDINFATRVIEMEKQKNLKFCVKDRDLVGGAFEHDTIIKLIAERCNRLIVILSPAFLASNENNFFLRFAQAIGIDQKMRKVIPCMYTPCEVPFELKCYVILYYDRSNKLWNFWDKLYNSIKMSEKEVKKPNLNRAVSHQAPSKSLYKPAIPEIQANGLSKSKKEGVKFNSMQNLNNCDSSTEEANSVKEKKSSGKKSWIKKILPSSNKAKAEGLQEKGKRKFWQRNSKRKVAEAN